MNKKEEKGKVDEISTEIKSIISGIENRYESQLEQIQEEVIDFKNRYKENSEQLNSILNYMKSQNKLFSDEMFEDESNEFAVLNLTNIRELKNKILELLPDADITAIGHFARSMFSEDNISDFVEPSKFLISDSKKCGAYILLNPAFIRWLFEYNRMERFSRKISDTLVFTMPKITDNNISVLWGKGFSGFEHDTAYYRWANGMDESEIISIFNGTNNIKRVKVAFIFATFDKNAVIRIKFENKIKEYQLAGESISINEDMVLVPGNNTMEIYFYGDPLQMKDARRLKYRIMEFMLKDNSDNPEGVLLKGEEVYQNTLESNYLAYILSERKIRGILHESGFFEIDTYLCDEQGIVKPLETTRFAEAWSEYYVYSSKAEECDLGEKGVMIYVAHRKGNNFSYKGEK